MDQRAAETPSGSPDTGHVHPGHGGDHYRRDRSQQALLIALGVTATFVVVEVIGGFITGSLALVADAGHMLTDVAALLLSLGAIWLARQPATPQRTFGLYRAEILAALVNGVALIVLAVSVVVEALQRIAAPPEVDSIPMVVIATAGLGANVLSAWVLARARSESLNVRGAFLHVLGDMLGSLGAIVAGVLMLTTGWYLADPILSVAMSLLIIWSTWRLLRETVNVLLEAAPPGIDVAAIRLALLAHPDVADVHDLHVWSVSSGFVALSSHVRLQQPLTGAAHQRLLGALRALLHEEFTIAHTTIQMEEPGFVEEEETACYI